MLLIIESGLRSAAVVSYSSPVLVAVVIPQPTPSISMLAPCKWELASSEPDALWSVDSSDSLLPTSTFSSCQSFFLAFYLAKPPVKVNILVLKNFSKCFLEIQIWIFKGERKLQAVTTKNLGFMKKKYFE
jgi:hypothetical protein